MLFSILLILLIEKFLFQKTKKEFETMCNLDRRRAYEVRDESRLELGEINNNRRRSA